MKNVESSRICLKNLPKYVDDTELRTFIDKVLINNNDNKFHITDCKVLKKNGITRRVAFIGFQEASQAKLAQKKLNRTFFDTTRLKAEIALPVGHKILIDRAKKNSKYVKREKQEKKKVDRKDVDAVMRAKMSFFDSDNEENDNIEEEDVTRLFVRNLNYNTSEEDLEKHFSSFGEVNEVQILKDSTGKSKGFGFVTFESAESCLIALTKLDGVSFQGRLLHVLPAHEKLVLKTDTSDVTQENTSFKKGRKEKEIKEASNETNWNALFIRSDAVLSAFSKSKSINLTKSELVAAPEKLKETLKDSNFTDSTAVNLALMETEIIRETKDFLIKNGVSLANLEKGIKNPFGIPRSNNTLLVKNLPNDTDGNELRQMFVKFGEVEKFVLPPSKTMALVTFFESKHAMKAFKGLAYRRYRSLPLFLEKAPADTMNTETTEEKSKETIQNIERKSFVNEEAPADLFTSTLFIKNLNFDTTEADLKKHIISSTGQEGNIRKVTITKHMKHGKALSKGFGFVEFTDMKKCKLAMRKLNKTILQKHELQVSISDSTTPFHTKKDQALKLKKLKRKIGQNTDKAVKSTKLLVKNIAFEATKSEIHKLFSRFGDIQSVRLPKTFNKKSRGFCFVTFSGESEAKEAMSALHSTHLYGRKLVIEWAKVEAEASVLNKKQKI